MSKTNLKKTLIISYITCIMTSLTTTMLFVYIQNQKTIAQLMELIVFLFAIIPISIGILLVFYMICISISRKRIKIKQHI